MPSAGAGGPGVAAEFGGGTAMAHGLRVRLRRAAWTGVGVFLCTGLVGCLNDDKPKPMSQPPMAKGSQPGGMNAARPGLNAGNGYGNSNANVTTGGPGGMAPANGGYPAPGMGYPT